MATSYNACSSLTFSAPQERTSVLYSSPSTHSASTHSEQSNHSGGHTPLHNPIQPHASAYNLNYGHYETVAMEHIGSVQTYLTSPVSTFSSTLTCAYNATSPQPSLYQVPPFGDSISPINGYPAKMHKYSPFSSAFSLMSPNTSTAFSSRNFRSTTCTSTSDSSGRVPFVSRKSNQLSHYTSPRSNNRADILLDRKAFICLEKSINWEAAFPCSTSPVTPSAQNPSPGNSPFQCAPDSDTCSQSYHLTSPQLSQVTSALQLSDSSKDDSSFSSSDANWSASNGEGDFTLPGMKDVPAWLKCKCSYFISILSILATSLKCGLMQLTVHH